MLSRPNASSYNDAGYVRATNATKEIRHVEILSTIMICGSKQKVTQQTERGIS